MKYFALSAAVAFAFAVSNPTFAQTKTAPISSPEKGAAMEMPGPEGAPGEMVILPNQSIPEEPIAEAPAKVRDEEEPVIKNVAHKRNASKIGKMQNGYYKMKGHADWGTNATLNGYGYEQVAPAAPYDPADAPVFLAGDEEAANDGQAPAADWTDEPAATQPAATDAKSTDAKSSKSSGSAKSSASKKSSSSNGSYNW